MQEKLYPWRWAILIGMTVLLVSLQFSFIVPGGAAILVMQQYQCEPMMFSMIMSIPYFSGVLFCMAGGVLADRLGLGKVFAAAFVVSLLGALARCFSADYWTLFASSFFMGMGVAALNAWYARPELLDPLGATYDEPVELPDGTVRKMDAFELCRPRIEARGGTANVVVVSPCTSTTSGGAPPSTSEAPSSMRAVSPGSAWRPRMASRS